MTYGVRVALPFFPRTLPMPFIRPPRALSYGAYYPGILNIRTLRVSRIEIHWLFNGDLCTRFTLNDALAKRFKLEIKARKEVHYKFSTALKYTRFHHIKGLILQYRATLTRKAQPTAASAGEYFIPQRAIKPTFDLNNLFLYSAARSRWTEYIFSQQPERALESAIPLSKRGNSTGQFLRGRE